MSYLNEVSSEVRRGIQFLGAGVRGSYELPYVGSGNLEINSWPLQQHREPLTVVLLLQSSWQHFILFYFLKKSYESQLIHLDKQHVESEFAAKAKP